MKHPHARTAQWSHNQERARQQCKIITELLGAVQALRAQAPQVHTQLVASNRAIEDSSALLEKVRERYGRKAAPALLVPAPVPCQWNSLQRRPP